MISFFIALFGGAYYVTRYTVESGKSSRLDKWSARARAITNQATDNYGYLAGVFKRLIETADGREEIRSAVGTELAEVFGADWSSRLARPPDKYLDYWRETSPWWPAYHIYLAKHGKTDVAFPSLVRNNGDKGQRFVVVKTAQIVERNIQRFHPELRLIFVPAEKDSARGKKYPEYYPQLHLGRLMWEHELVPNCHQQAAKRRLWESNDSAEVDYDRHRP